MADGADFWVSESAEKTLAEAKNDASEIVEMIESIESVTPQILLEFYEVLEVNTNNLRTLLDGVKITRTMVGNNDGEGLRVPAEVENTIAKATFLVGRIAVLAVQLKTTPFKELNAHHRKLLKQAREAYDLLAEVEVKSSESEKEEEVKRETPTIDEDASLPLDSGIATKSKAKTTRPVDDKQASGPRRITRRKARMGNLDSPIVLASDDEKSSDDDDENDEDWRLSSPIKKKRDKRRRTNGKEKPSTSKTMLNSDLDSDETI
ncbi:uncharacterized protein FA14DRAFT_155182 [Meira miltonrushii]|uniref:Uncharacterized protein n=1 Tax=Meira miltonrushii TaxID=1280837 RepID=A0A316VE39_9BASI|nr:uncharacterized protein FA14DRAFT_155182 [Meira miltonrushii]PWN35770.1 hypothetical protein FA14DRAFT_155182 [Meira miltonrushii]